MNAGPSRARKTVVLLAAALLTTFALYRFRADESPGVAPTRPLPRSSMASTVSGAEPLPPTARRSPLPSSASARDGHSAASALQPQVSAQGRPTPGVVDLAAAARSPSKPAPESDEERFPTNERFTHEDLQHPERYFERAMQMPELNRPEERRDTLAFFLAYREKLQRDLAAVGDDRGEREETMATLQRYDAAISRLRTVIQSEAAE